MLDVKRYPRESLRDEKGMVLVVALLLISVLLLLGTTAVMTSTTDMKISTNYKTGAMAFYIAEAGAEHARERLRLWSGCGYTMTQILHGCPQQQGCQATATSCTSCTPTACPGTAVTLTDSGNIANFRSGDTWASTNTPLISDTTFGSGSYRVYLTNDAKAPDVVTSSTDSNNTATVTSFGFGPQSSMAAVQETVRKLIPPGLPGAIVLPGPNAVFAGGNSTAQVISGVTEAAVAVNFESSRINVIAGIPKADSYIGDCPPPSNPCVQNLSFGPPWDSLPDLKALVASLASTADFTSTSAPGFTWGSTANPKIVYINGDATIGPETGAGIIICTGNLSVHGNFAYDGLIMAIGKGKITRDGGGSGKINGSIFAANILGPDGILNTGDDAFGAPTYDTSGGGTSDVTYNADSLNNAQKRAPYIKTSWKQSGLD